MGAQWHWEEPAFEHNDMDSGVLEQACWLLITYGCGLTTKMVNSLITAWCRQHKLTMADFINTDPQERQDVSQLSAAVCRKLQHIARTDVSNGSSTSIQSLIQPQVKLLKQLADDGIVVLTQMDYRYPRQILTVLKPQECPPLLFAMGDLTILDRQSIAIIGTRQAQEKSLLFAREIAQQLAEQGMNIICGNARGVDREAYEGAANTTEGYVTLVLPHGINRLSDTQLFRLLPRITTGKVLLLSQFHPEVPWMVSREIERIKVVIGLARAMIVAESQCQGGTWNAAISSLTHHRPVFIQQPGDGELYEGNQALIKRGGISLPWEQDDCSIRDASINNVLSSLSISNQVEEHALVNDNH